MRKPFLALALMLVIAVETSAQGVEPRLRAFLEEVRSMEAAFEQTLYDENFQRVEDSSGHFYLQRPGKFRWDYKEPYSQEIVGDGKKVWIFDPELDQVTVRNIDVALGNTPALLLSSDIPLEDNFLLSETGSRNGLDWIELKPKSTDGAFTAIRFGFESRALKMIELMDNFGQTTFLSFFSTVRNPDLSPDLFRFEPPEGVDVIE